MPIRIVVENMDIQLKDRLSSSDQDLYRALAAAFRKHGPDLSASFKELRETVKLQDIGDVEPLKSQSRSALANAGKP